VFIFLLPHVLTNSLRVHVLTLTLELHWDKPEDVMNKLMTAALVAGGLMLLNTPEAAAHTEVRYSHEPPPRYYNHRGYYRGADMRRSEHMPRWLKRNKSFRKWYRHSSLRRNWRLAWDDLFDIYRWDRRYGKRYNKRYDHDGHYRNHHRDNKRRDGRHEGRRNRY